MTKSDKPQPADDAAKRRRLAEVFGEVLPETTADERDAPEGDRESWYRENKPPHHGA